MDAYFTDLGGTILDRWKRENFTLTKFPEIARKSLDERPPATQVDMAAFVRDFLLREDQPLQSDSPFGEPEIIAYFHPRFYIQLLFWMDGTTAIHQHEFSGAFHVMHGSSIHAHYEFDNARAVTSHLRVGDVKVKKIEILETGRTVPIVSGHQTIHSLFHLDTPSVTVVVRTHNDPGTGPQLNYLPPHLAIDPLFNDTLTMRRNQLLDVLEQVEDESYSSVVTEMIADLDFERGFYVLRNSMNYLQQLDQWRPAIKAFEKKHKALAGGVAVTLAEEVRRGVVKGMRGAVVEPEHRFFLALLMNAPTKVDLLKLVSQRFPALPAVVTVRRWVEELTEASDEGTSILDAVFPETIEVDPEARPDIFQVAFGHFIKPEKKLPPELRDLSPSDLADLRTAFMESTLGVLLV